MKGVLIISITAIVVVLVSWAVNLSKLIDCDFASPYKCEVVHGIGIVPIISVVTACVDSDK